MRIQSAVASEEALSDEQVVLSGRVLSIVNAVMRRMRKRLLGLPTVNGAWKELPARVFSEFYKLPPASPRV